MPKFKTSPLLFLRPGNQVSLEGRPLDRRFSLADLELLTYFAEASSCEEAISNGHESNKIDEFLKAGLLVQEAQETEFCRGETWEVYNLQRAAFLMFNTVFKKDSEPQSRTYENTSNEIVVESFGKLLNRRTERFFTDENVDKKQFEELIMEFNYSIKKHHWLSYRVLVQGVDGYDKAIYKPDAQGKLIKAVDSYTKKDLMEAVHGQWWLNGAGFCFFLVVDLNALKNRNSADNPKSYFEMIIQLGAAGQALLNTVYKHELGSWMTPAVSETMAAKILGLDQTREESLYFFKVGIPQRAEEKDERRSPI